MIQHGVTECRVGLGRKYHYKASGVLKFVLRKDLHAAYHKAHIQSTSLSSMPNLRFNWLALHIHSDSVTMSFERRKVCYTRQVQTMALALTRAPSSNPCLQPTISQSVRSTYDELYLSSKHSTQAVKSSLQKECALTVHLRCDRPTKSRPTTCNSRDPEFP